MELLQLQVLRMDGGTASGRSRKWLLAALQTGALSQAQSVIVYVAFQVRAALPIGESKLLLE